jgi:hypothetical protein
MRSSWRSVFAGLALLAVGANVHATEALDDEAGLAELASRSDGVFVGTAVAVVERMSRPTASTPALPFTFVTYAVEEDIAGGLPGADYTLRFLGGTFPDGRVLQGSHVPRIAVGDRDLLFVSANGESAVPLVEGDARFPVRSGEAVEGLQLADDGQRLLRSGPDVDGRPVDIDRLVPLLRGMPVAGGALPVVDPDAAFTFEMPLFDGPPAPAPEPPMPADEIAERRAAGF